MRSVPFQTRRSRLFLVLAGIALFGASLLLAHRLLYHKLLEEAMERANQQAFFLQMLIDTSPEILTRQSFMDVARQHNIRLTHMDAKGKVVQDSAVDAKDLPHLENHSDRLEFILAKELGVGTAVRTSGTVHNEALYTAVRLADGSFLRVGVPFVGVNTTLNEHFTLLLALAGIAVGVTALLFNWRARQLQRDLRRISRGVSAIAKGNYEYTVSHLGRGEFIPLAEAINTLAKDIKNTLGSLTDKNSQMETILESLQEGVVVLGARGGIRSCNRALLRMFPAAESCEGKQVIEILPFPALQAAIEERMHTPRPSVQTLRWDVEGRRQLLVHLCQPSQVSVNVALIVIVHDVTSLIQLERTHKDFVANVSHELRTPLTAIKGYAETLVGNACTPDECRHFGQKILKHGDFLANTVEDLLTLARVDDEGKSIDTEPVDPFVCAALAKQLVSVAPSYARCIEISGEEGAVCRVHANKFLLAQALRNLLENACRYAPAESVITVGIEQQEGACLLSVSDQGAGIPAQEHERIFERFYRVERLRNSETTGLGLAIARQIVERFGGTLWVQSPSPTAKTTFYISLPCLTKT